MITVHLGQTDAAASAAYRQQQMLRNYLIEIQKLLLSRGYPVFVTGSFDQSTWRSVNMWLTERGYQPLSAEERRILSDPRMWQASSDLFHAILSDNPEFFTHQRLRRPAGGVG